MISIATTRGRPVPVATRRSEATRAIATFRAVYAVLTIHFASLGIVYLVDPDRAVRSFSRVNEALGGVVLAPPDVAPWRYATVCGMTTLAVMTLLMVIRPRRYAALLWPAAWFKGLNALLWFWYAASNESMPVFVLAGAVDLVVVAVMVVVARRAWAVPSADARS